MILTDFLCVRQKINFQEKQSRFKLARNFSRWILVRQAIQWCPIIFHHWWNHHQKKSREREESGRWLTILYKKPEIGRFFFYDDEHRLQSLCSMNKHRKWTPNIFFFITFLLFFFWSSLTQISTLWKLKMFPFNPEEAFQATRKCKTTFFFD